MREIEFRAKTSSEICGFNRKKDSLWVYGFYRDKVGLPTISEFDIFCADYIDYEVDRNTLGQYTGLKDKNGKKIFEGDIVKGNFPYAKKCVVVWDNKRCGFYLKPISKLGRASYDPYYKLNSAKLEIIGNIFDNGELLNEN